MINKFICPPAFINLIFTMIHATVSVFEKKYKKANLQFVVGIIITIFLQLLCMGNLEMLSWIIVFVPFILYTYIISALYYKFGLDFNDKDDTES